VATVRFETEPGEQAQVDFGSVRYRTPEGSYRRLWVFVMVLSWSRMMYVEFVRRADTATFIRCHLHAFERLGVPKRCLYDNAKLVVLERDEQGEPVWNAPFLDFALRLGFEIRLCRPRRPQTKGRVERAIDYVKDNLWPTVRFADLDDLNRQAQFWCDTEANVRIHGTTHERPCDRWAMERSHLQPLPTQEKLAAFLRESRQVGRDGFVQFERSWYGLPQPWWPGQMVEIQPGVDRVEIWSGARRLIVHPRASSPGQRFRAPGQWAGLKPADRAVRREPTAVQLPSVEVEQRSLTTYEALAAEVTG
jgi:hypothetical protein